uniref:Transmembrane protein 252 n=1 Tax=Acanthochromis polyacanthus TaxID=80966 RepID=A0A3Q1EWK3_9TELE
MKQQLWGLLRMLLPALGFAMTCSGAYLLSLQAHDDFDVCTILIYIQIILGFVAIVSGVLWTVCHSMKSKMFCRGRHEQRIQVFTVERPSCFPPSYEASEGSLVSSDTPYELAVRVDGVDMVMIVAPPLYSQDGSEPPDCTFSWEQPPRYSVVEGLQRGQAEEQREASSGH